MQKSIRSILTLLSVVLLTLGSTSCSPQAKKAGHLKKAESYFAAGDYSKAEIEYMNVLQIEPLNPAAIGRLGLIYFDQGRVGRVLPFLVKGSELQPDNLDLRNKLGWLYLSFGKTKEAREQANYVLDRRPQDEQAPIVLAEAAVKPDEIAAAKKRLLSLPPPATESAPGLVALGTLEFRARQPKDAEAAVRRALARDPKSSAAQSALGMLCLANKDLSQAEGAFKQAAALASAHSPHQLLYARFKAQAGDYKAARAAVEEITKKTPDYLPAWILQAEIAATEKRFPDGSAAVDKVLALDPAHPEALLLGARIKLAMGENDQALAQLEKMLKMYPQSPQAYYQQGLAYLASGDAIKATVSLNQAIALAPGFADALLALAEINFRKGDYRTVVTALTPLTKQRPDIIKARFLLADAYRAQGDLAQAFAVYQQLEESLPRDPQPSHWKGTVLLQQNKRAEARQAFNRALELAPNFLLSLDQLISLELADKNYANARQLVEKQIALDPKQPGPYLLQARVFLAQQLLPEAENSLRKTIELRPDAPTPYLLLARLYTSSKQLEKALVNFQSVLTKSPKNLEALMMIATIYEQQKNYPAARDAYEKLLTVNPKFSAALNNLAYLYSEQFNQLDKAQELAKKARELLPNEPHAADTLGWILYQKGQFPWALSMLQESADKLPESADVQYHLGMTHYRMGAEAPARAALQLALQLQNDFPGAEEARRSLAILAIQPESAGAGAQAELERALAERPDDPVALARLAAIQIRAGATEKAIGTYENALRANPKNVPAMLSLAKIYATRKDSAKALELAKAARKLAPEDAEVAQTLGLLAYRTGDYNWSFSLLQEAVRKQPDDLELQFGLAEAAYSTGHIPEAEAAMQRVATAGALFSQANEARRFLEMIAAANNPEQTAAETQKIEEALKADAAYVPALMAQAAMHERKAAAATAQSIYEKVLGIYPDFTPAKRKLVILYSADPGKNQKGFDLAMKAREAFPDDAELAKAYGIIVYRQGDFTRAANLLRESIRQRSDDAELAYFLGAAQLKLKQRNEGRQSLQRALDLKLKPELAVEAKRLLAEPK